MGSVNEVLHFLDSILCIAGGHAHFFGFPSLTLLKLACFDLGVSYDK